MSQNRPPLKVLVTGSSGGIGKHIVHHFLSQGHQVYGLSRAGYYQCKEKTPIPPMELSFPKHLSAPDHQKIPLAEKDNTPLDADVVINSIGGGGSHQTHTDTSQEKWIEVYTSNVVIPLKIASTVADLMKARRWGRIINIASVAATKPLAVGPEYSAAKAACISATQSMAKAYSAYGITANCISPGLVETYEVVRMIESMKQTSFKCSDDFNTSVASDVFPSLTKKLVSPQQIADTISFLCSESANSITGQNIILDGGYSLI